MQTKTFNVLRGRRNKAQLRALRACPSVSQSVCLSVRLSRIKVLTQKQ